MANGSSFGSRCRRSSIASATSRATASPHSSATNAAAMSVPAETPEDVHRSRSCTQRAERRQSMSWPKLVAHANARLLLVDLGEDFQRPRYV